MGGEKGGLVLILSQAGAAPSARKRPEADQRWAGEGVLTSSRREGSAAALTRSLVNTNPLSLFFPQASAWDPCSRGWRRYLLLHSLCPKPERALDLTECCAPAHWDRARERSFLAPRSSLPRALARRLGGTRRLGLGGRSGGRARARVEGGGPRAPVGSVRLPQRQLHRSLCRPGPARPSSPLPPPAAARAHAPPEREGRLRVCGGGRAELRGPRVRTWGRGMVSARGGAGGAAAAADATAAAAAAAASSAPASRRWRARTKPARGNPHQRSPAHRPAWSGKPGTSGWATYRRMCGKRRSSSISNGEWHEARGRALSSGTAAHSGPLPAPPRARNWWGDPGQTHGPVRTARGCLAASLSASRRWASADRARLPPSPFPIRRRLSLGLSEAGAGRVFSGWPADGGVASLRAAARVRCGCPGQHARTEPPLSRDQNPYPAPTTLGPANSRVPQQLPLLTLRTRGYVWSREGFVRKERLYKRKSLGRWHGGISELERHCWILGTSHGRLTDLETKWTQMFQILPTLFWGVGRRMVSENKLVRLFRLFRLPAFSAQGSLDGKDGGDQALAEEEPPPATESPPRRRSGLGVWTLGSLYKAAPLPPRIPTSVVKKCKPFQVKCSSSRKIFPRVYFLFRGSRDSKG